MVCEHIRSDLFSLYISFDLLDRFVHMYIITHVHNNNRVDITCSKVCAYVDAFGSSAQSHTHTQIPVRTQICQSTCTNTTFYISVVTTLWELRFKFYRLVHGDFSSTNLAKHHFGLTHLAEAATMAGQILLNGLTGAFLSAD